MTRHPRSLAALLLLTVPLFAPRSAFAQPSDADRATARALARQGYEASVNQDFAAAAELFRRADALVHAPTLLLGLARAQAALGQLVEAEEVYTRIVREGIPPHSPPPFAKAVEDAKKEGALLAPRLGWLTMEVHGGDVAGASVTLDGVPVPAAALGIRRATNPGPHTLRVALEGFAPATKSCFLAEGATDTVSVELEIDPHLTQPKETTYKAAPPAPAPPSTSLRKTIAFGALGLGGAGLVVGGITGGLVLAKHSSLAEECPDGRCTRDHGDDLASYHALGTVSTVSFIVGAVSASAGAILLFTAPKAAPGAHDGKETSASPSWGIGISPTGASFKGTF